MRPALFVSSLCFSVVRLLRCQRPVRRRICFNSPEFPKILPNPYYLHNNIITLTMVTTYQESPTTSISTDTCCTELPRDLQSSSYRAMFPVSVHPPLGYRSGIRTEEGAKRGNRKEKKSEKRRREGRQSRKTQKA